MRDEVHMNRLFYRLLTIVMLLASLGMEIQAQVPADTALYAV